ncbi:hypothetical protein BEWA_031370 [Theileria equi strain WA]|uniref:Uncharacterized protein n=1 Tax=Theileria equi strain WA TaxID=1537102 RepID=L0AZF6_THEEQ|nr:hypothetical protein BEWA_031370 [Theileria equi strain WA]AFZ80284.1 hypothetical protein BEWA_031370 [Theileria equi strain WA]|eukprot:XP_004829950.1 hypothetical protein BEWA_031370 [Theileria equi strain WA]
MSTIDIKHKCHNGKSGKNKCICQSDGRIEVKGGTLKYTYGKETDYKYCTHSFLTTWIANLNYGGSPLQIYNGGGQSRQFSDAHQVILEVTTYYSATYDNDDEETKKPLLLRINDKNGYSWYSNADADYKKEYEGEPKGKPNTRWKFIPDVESQFYQEHITPTPELETQLNSLTCKLHDLHSVNIYQNGDFKRTYYCPCGQANVTIEPTSNYTPTGGYICYLHTYDPNVTRARYRSTLLEWRMSKNDDKYGPFSLNQQTPTLYVFYWDKDTERTKPLIIGVYVGKDSGGIPVPVCNDGYSDNSKWTMIPDRLGEHVFSGTLHEQKCRLFHPVEIDITSKGHYKNPHSEKEGCKMEECSKNIQVTNYGGLNLKNYTARKHTYGEPGETFTIIKLTEGPSPIDILTGSFPIWDVREVVVFFSSCGNAKTPLLVYVGSNDEKARKWYKNTDPKGDKWEEETKLEGKDPREADRNGSLVSTLSEIKNKLRLSCSNGEKLVVAANEVQHQQHTSVVTPGAAGGGSDGGLWKTVDPLIDLGITGLNVATALGTVAVNTALEITEKALKNVAGPSDQGTQQGIGELDSATANSPDLNTNQGESTNSGGDGLQGSRTDARGPNDPALTPGSPQGTEGSESNPSGNNSQDEVKKEDSSEEPTPTAPPGHAEAQGSDLANTPGGQTLAYGGSDLSEKPTNPDLKIVVGVPTGILGTSALACFLGYKLYSRYKGDPWVRQI